MMNPSYSFPNTMLESKRMLREVMSEAEALEVMDKNPAVLQCGPSLDLFGADEIKMIAQMRSVGNLLVPPQVRAPLVALLIATVALTVFERGGDSAELTALVDGLRPLLGLSIGGTFAVAVYGASQIGRKPAA